MSDPAKFRREYMRWVILLTLNNARPLGTSDETILYCVRGEFHDATLIEARQEIGYLQDRRLVEVKIPPDGSAWWCKLTRYGVDVAEHTVDVEPGIARPQKYGRL